MNIFTYLLLYSFTTSVRSDLSDVGLTTPEIIENHGYVVETHQVTTEDGYIVTLHRIPHGIDDDGAKKSSVFLMHGFTSCFADYVNMGPGRSLGFLLADAGYDVWMGNSRGNAYSRNHTFLDPFQDAEEFFDFSWHEIGYYDVAASIDYILNINGDDSLYYIGHSQGTTTFFVLTSTRPEYNAKIREASLMAPFAYLEHHPFDFLAVFSKYIERVEALLKKYEIFEIPFVDALRKWAVTNCAKEEYLGLCEAAISLVGGGIGNGLVEEEMLPIILTNTPSNAAMKQGLHFGQLIKYGGFAQYSYGPEKNMEVYGTESPPPYDLSKISVPVALYYSVDDGVVPVEDVYTVRNQLPNIVDDREVGFETFNHLDFIYAKNAAILIYEQLMKVMEKY